MSLNWALHFENKVETYLKSRETLLKKMDLEAVVYPKPSVTSASPSDSIKPLRFGSSLKEDFVCLLEFDLKVDRYIEKPVTIIFHDDMGVQQVYTPDLLVFFKDDPEAEIPYHCPLLVDINSRPAIKKNWAKVKSKYLIAMRYCDAVGWKFKIRTEKEIRTQFTKNVKFLLPYMRIAPDHGPVQQIYYALGELGPSTISELTSFYSNDPMIQAELIRPLWFLVGNLMVGCNLGEKLTANTMIWALER